MNDSSKYAFTFHPFSGLGGVTFFILLFLFSCSNEPVRIVQDFNSDWKFFLGNDSLAYTETFDDSEWRLLNLPHDWSIEGDFSEENTTGYLGGYLPAGVGWYRKSFKMGKSDEARQYFIDFDGVYRNSEVWINGNYLGKRPFGYLGFRYDITSFLRYGNEKNVVAVKVDNSAQPNSRWYTGSGIYRNVWLVSTGNAFVDHWGTYVTTPKVDAYQAEIVLQTTVRHNAQPPVDISIESEIISPNGRVVAKQTSRVVNESNSELFTQNFIVKKPSLWSVKDPNLYKVKSKIYKGKKLVDQYTTEFGIREFRFDAEKGFFLNGEYLKLKGANMHHDLGALGAAFNTRAAERQLEILRDMGCNAIRMAHNPPATELLQLCDRMGFLVIDESFDCWVKKKLKHDYHDDWDEWHERDLRDMVLRDRNHPSIIAWSIGNEIREQFDSTGLVITAGLANIVKALDPTRPVTCALTENVPEKNFIYQSKALDVLSFNYKHRDYPDFPNRFPGEAVIASENMSAYATRGVYNQPSDSNRVWPVAHNIPIQDLNPDHTCSAYDHVYAYWGATHEDTWKLVKKLDFISGMFIWSGFDYIGEPTPYPWPARSSYFGVIDLAGFPKDVYYMYQSEWTDKKVLHLFPHWNWTEGETIDVWAYYNHADEVELFLNGESQGIKKKENDNLHVMWRLPFDPGVLKAVSRKAGEVVLEREIHTAGEPAKIELVADRSSIQFDGRDLSFVTVRILDMEGNLVPNANNLVHFDIKGAGFIAGVDNGYQASHERFKDLKRKAWKGMCLTIIQSNGEKGEIILEATSEGLPSATLKIKVGAK
jgi:beta-galactosidase